MSTLQRAIEIAVEAHANQSGRDGLPYVLHPLRMMLQMRTDPERIVAILHDVVEDNADWPLARLAEAGFDADVLQAVDDMTRREGESYEAFVRRAAQRPLARTIKKADLRDNMNIERLPTFDAQDAERLKRYHKALVYVMELEGHTPAGEPAD
jgi:(p)ppGpp synthase/HD superfamily hydrolase